MSLFPKNALLFPVYTGTYLIVGLILGYSSAIFLEKASNGAYFFFLVLPLGLIVALCFPALFLMGLISRILGTNEIISSVILVVISVIVIAYFLFLTKKTNKQI